MINSFRCLLPLSSVCSNWIFVKKISFRISNDIKNKMAATEKHTLEKVESDVASSPFGIPLRPSTRINHRVDSKENCFFGSPSKWKRIHVCNIASALKRFDSGRFVNYLECMHSKRIHTYTSCKRDAQRLLSVQLIC